MFNDPIQSQTLYKALRVASGGGTMDLDEEEVDYEIGTAISLLLAQASLPALSSNNLSMLFLGSIPQN